MQEDVIYLKKTIKIKGMKCDKCASRVKNALEKFDEINKVEVNLDDGSVNIEYNKELDLNKVCEEIDNIGFGVKD